jgi:ADP-L-glycero-D-manno-heptose 6-epimerase
MKILITGHEGFIGKNLIQFLGKDKEIYGYDWDPKIRPDVAGFDWVIHLGAISATTESDVDKIMLQNYEFSKWLFNECNTQGVNLQYASSASVYGTNTNFNEDAPKQPQSPYAWSKYLFDRWVMQQEHNITVQGFRYFNVYGNLEDHKGDQASPYAKFTKQAKETSTINLFENSEMYRRDFVCVNDVSQVHQKMLSVNKSGIWNIGTGTTVSFLEMAKLIAVKNNAIINVIPMPDKLKNQYQKYTCADITKLNSVIDHKFISVEEFVNASN